MSKLWRITPLEKKSIEFFIDVYETQPDGNIRGFDATFVYRWGQAFRDETNPPSRWEAQQPVFYSDPGVGWGCEFDDLISVYVNFTEGFTDQEREQIEALCRGEQEDQEGRWGEAWIFDGDHNWQIEDNSVCVHRPFRIDLVKQDEYNVVIEENVELED